MATRWLTALSLLTSIALIGTAVDHWSMPVLGPPLERNGYGRAAVITGPLPYPREATDANGTRITIHRKPQRIASQGWSIDEYLYSIVAPERIVAVSESAYISGVSNVLDLVQLFKPTVAVEPERVLRLNPDLILVTSSSRVDFTTLMRASGIPVYRLFIDFTTYQQIEEYISLIGYLTGEDDRAETLKGQFHQQVQKAIQRRPPINGADGPKVLGLGGKYTYGANTLFDDGLKLLGAINPAAEAGMKGYDMINSEQLARWNPDWIIAGAPAAAIEETRQKIREDPGVALTTAGRKNQILVLENRVFLPMSPFSIGRLTALSEALWK